jgi:uncharacterized protein YegJ (DUF2314 family)
MKIEDIKPGDLVQVAFPLNRNARKAVKHDRGIKLSAERMWLEVATRDGDMFTGHLRNHPELIAGLTFGTLVTFCADNIVDIHDGSES